ncbi:hypothetical protein Tco_0455067 [Tanacetum coccineum]
MMEMAAGVQGWKLLMAATTRKKDLRGRLRIQAKFPEDADMMESTPWNKMSDARWRLVFAGRDMGLFVFTVREKDGASVDMCVWFKVDYIDRRKSRIQLLKGDRWNTQKVGEEGVKAIN